MVVAPLAVCRSRLDGDALLTLKLHGVHLGTNAILSTDLRGSVESDSAFDSKPSVTDLMNLFDLTSVEQDTLSQSGLA